MAPKVVVAVRLDPEDIAALHAGAKYRGVKPSEWMRRVLANQAQADRKSGKALTSSDRRSR